MANLVVKIDLGVVKASRRRNGACWCGSDPIGDLVSFVSTAGVKRDRRGKLVDAREGVDVDALWESTATILHRKRAVFVCAEKRHNYVNRFAVVG